MVPLFSSVFKLRLQDGQALCEGSMGTELYDLIPNPYYGYIILDSDRTVYYRVPLYVKRLNKAFKKLVSMKVTPGEYNVQVTLSWHWSESTTINCKMDLASCTKLKKIVQSLRPSFWEETNEIGYTRKISIYVHHQPTTAGRTSTA